MEKESYVEQILCDKCIRVDRCERLKVMPKTTECDSYIEKECDENADSN